MNSAWENWAISIATFLPLVGAIVIAFVPSAQERSIRALGIVFTGAALVIAIAIAIGIAASLLRPPTTAARREPAASDREAAGAVPANAGERPPLERGGPPMAN
jgi:hypothetical protein